MLSVSYVPMHNALNLLLTHVAIDMKLIPIYNQLSDYIYTGSFCQVEHINYVCRQLCTHFW